MKSLIVIPARYESTRLPGKPLLPIAGATLLERVVAIARAASKVSGADFVVATDDERIIRHAEALKAPAVLTDRNAPSGSDRALAAVKGLGATPDFVINLQGDAPFAPPEYLVALIAAAEATDADVFTPVVQLGWDDLDALREKKRTSPSSGTTCIVAPDGRALWFSKHIIPALRDETKLRQESPLSPILRHVGIYGYRHARLVDFVALPVSHYERLEGLEQLRILEAGMRLHAVRVPAPRISMSGIDTPADVASAERLIQEKGDPFTTGSYI